MSLPVKVSEVGTPGTGGWTGYGTSEEGNDSYKKEPTAETTDGDLPANCSPWQYSEVGYSELATDVGYMVCGVTVIKLDIISQYTDARGQIKLEYTYHTMSTLYFEMLGRYSPGEAATLSAQIKDRAEQSMEDKYGSTGTPALAITLENVSLMRWTDNSINLVDALQGDLIIMVYQ